MQGRQGKREGRGGGEAEKVGKAGEGGKTGEGGEAGVSPGEVAPSAGWPYPPTPP